MDNIIRCPYKADRLEIPQGNFGQVLMEALRSNPTTCLIDVSTGREIAGTSLAQQAEQIGSGLRSLGCDSGDVVCIFGSNSIEWIQAAVAILYIDAIPAGINHMLKEDELAIHLESCCPKVLFCDDSLIDIARAAVKKMAKHQIRIITTGQNGDVLNLKDLITSTSYSISDHATSAKLRSGKDPSLIMFSSGTSGVQKPVVQSHEAVLLQSLISRHPDTAFVFEKALAFAPFSHMVGFFCVAFCLQYGAGCLVCLMPRYDFQLFVSTIDKYKIHNLFIVPPVATQLAKSPLVSQYKLNLKSLVIGAAPLGKDLEHQLYERFPGLQVRQSLGLTELTGACAIIPARVGHQRREGSVGLPVFNTEIKVVDLETGKDLKAKQSGEILVRSPMVMLGYLNNSEATQQALDKDGWLRTGDIGCYDENGYFYVTDRLKELIKYNAYQVAPAELESVLLSHDDVEDAAVVGIPHSSSGEVPMAVVVLKSTASATELQLEAFVNSKVAAHKKIRGGVKFIATIPKTGSGKILRREIKAQLFKNKL